MFKISKILDSFDYEHDASINPHTYVESLNKTKAVCSKALEGSIKRPVLDDFFNALMDNFKSHEEIFLNCFFHIKNSDDFITQHILNTMFLSYALTRWLHFKEDDLSKAVALAFFIDLSLVRVDNILKKKRILTIKEKEVINHHPDNSAQSFHSLYPERKESFNFIKSHHTYHYKKYKTEHKELKKIFELVILSENFESFIHPKPHRRALKPHQAMSKIRKEFNYISKETLKDFINYIGMYPATTVVKLNTKEKGAVVSQNKGFPLRPKVRVLGNRSVKRGKIVDLLTEKNIFIEQVL